MSAYFHERVDEHLFRVGPLQVVLKSALDVEEVANDVFALAANPPEHVFAAVHIGALHHVPVVAQDAQQSLVYALVHVDPVGRAGLRLRRLRGLDRRRPGVRFRSRRAGFRRGALFSCRCAFRARAATLGTRALGCFLLLGTLGALGRLRAALFAFLARRFGPRGLLSYLRR